MVQVDADSLRRYGEIRSRLSRAQAGDEAAELTRLGCDPQTWAAFDAAHREAIDAGLVRGDTDHVVAFARGFEAADAPPGHAPVPPPERAGEAPSVPTFLLASGSQASGAGARELIIPQGVSIEIPADLDATAELDLRTLAAVALPFRPGPSSALGELRPADALPNPDSGTLEVDARALRAGLFPFERASTASDPLDPLTLEQYASLRAELSAGKASSSSILTRYAVDPSLWAAIDAGWKLRLAADATLRARCEQLVREFTAFVLARGW